MTVQGRFIVIVAVNSLLSCDYDFVLRICSTNFSYIANTCLFEGNILRLKSLASEQMYKLKNDAQNFEESSLDLKVEALNELFTAIESARNALSIY